MASLIYLPFVFWELRMSPNLHHFFYGYSQHDFAQTIRGTGYRPMVFMSHGLALARFLFVGICSAFILGHFKARIWGAPAKSVGWFLLVVLILCKSAGAIMFAAVTVPLLLWSKPTTQVRVAFVIALFVGLYPLLRMWDLIPTDQILGMMRALVGEDRTGSLAFRFMNERLLLDKARRQLVFGWGQYERNFAPYGWDGEAVPDGYWVIQLGILGLVGFIATFGTMLVPLMLVRSRLKAIVFEPHRILDRRRGTDVEPGGARLDSERDLHPLPLSDCRRAGRGLARAGLLQGLAGWSSVLTPHLRWVRRRLLFRGTGARTLRCPTRRPRGGESPRSPDRPAPASPRRSRRCRQPGGTHSDW